MKKVLVFAILISYSIASFGVSLNYFYCCGKLKSVSVRVKTEEKNCKKKSSEGCCDNKTVSLKLKVDQKETDKPGYQFEAPFSAAILQYNNYSFLNPSAGCGLNPLYKRPPPDNLPSRQILYCVFKI